MRAPLTLTLASTHTLPLALITLTLLPRMHSHARPSRPVALPHAAVLLTSR